MKMILAVIQPTKLRAVQEALFKVGVERITISDSQEFVEAEEPVIGGRANEYSARIHRKITLEIAVNDDFVDKTIATICEVAKTGTLGNDGDGKIFVLPLGEAIQFSPETRGQSAI